MGRFFRLILLLLLLPFSAVAGQNTAAPQPVQSEPAGSATRSLPVLGGTDRQITLDVQVTDKSGKPIRGLQEQDFTLLDDKVPRKIVSFHAVDVGAPATSDPPVEIVLVVDAINASIRSLAYERDEVKKFLLQNGGKLARPMSLVIFSEAGTDFSGSSRDGNALAEALDKYEIGRRSPTRFQDGFWGEADRIDLSLKALSSIVAHEKTQPGRKLVIWIGPGWPLLSLMRRITSKDAQQLFNSIVTASTELRQDRITLYSVDQLFPWSAGGTQIRYYENFLKGVTSPSRVLPGDMGVQVLSAQSGGRVLNTANDLTTEIANCTVDANAFYVLSFDSLPADQPDEYHALQVTVDKPGMTARTRTGYYDQR
ncbi:MAG TPA: VWA domain-containing protein [Terriglobales bacterium]|jgi:VWFA-related protein|nr:VWA domain-containing protein [Terriglobales bacterium]